MVAALLKANNILGTSIEDVTEVFPVLFRDQVCRPAARRGLVDGPLKQFESVWVDR